MMVFYEVQFPAAEFEVIETNLDQISKNELKILKKMQETLNNIMGTYDSSVKEFNKLSNINEYFKHLKEQHPIIFLLKHNNELVGHAIILKMKVPHRYHLSQFFISEKYRYGGLGTYFLSEIETKLKKYGAKVLQLNCLENNTPAIHTYTKNNYKVFNRSFAKEL